MAHQQQPQPHHASYLVQVASLAGNLAIYTHATPSLSLAFGWCYKARSAALFVLGAVVQQVAGAVSTLQEGSSLQQLLGPALR